MNQITMNRFEDHLRRLEEGFQFRAGQVRLERGGEVFLHVWPEPAPEAPGRHVITLSRNMRPVREVQHLPCGVLGSDGQLVVAAWTDELGRATIVLPDGDYRLRYVWTIQEAVDVQIFAMLGDNLARQYLADCLDDEQGSAELRERVRAALDLFPERDEEAEDAGQAAELARLLAEFRRVNAGQDEPVPVAATLVRELGGRWQNAWCCPATAAAESPATLGAQSSDDGPRPANVHVGRKSSSVQTLSAEGVQESPSAYTDDESPRPNQQDDRWIDLQGDQIVVRVPAELVPYGVVRIVAQVDDQLVGTCLLPLIKYGEPRGESSIRSNRCLAERVVGGCDQRTVTWYAQPALENTLAWFPAEEVAELLERPEVQDRAELRQRIVLLLELANERKQENEDDEVDQ